jgi:hypothetical protein
LVTSDVLAGSGVDGCVLSLHEGMRKYLNRNENDILNGSHSTSAVHLPVCCSGPAGMVLNQPVRQPLTIERV